MSMKRYFSATAREAIKLVRAELGKDAVILSNREVEGGVEVIASAPDDIAALIERTPRADAAPQPAAGSPAAPAAVVRAAAAALGRDTRAPRDLRDIRDPREALDARDLRSARARDYADELPAPAPAQTLRRIAPDSRVYRPATAPVAESFTQFVRRSEDARAAVTPEPAPAPRPVPAAHAAPAPAYRPPAEPVEPARPAPEAQMIAEILHVQSLMQEQMGVLSWRETANRRPLQARQIAQMLSAGFSPALARAIAEKLPADYNETRAGLWLAESLAGNIAAAPPEGDLVERGGIYALVGPTGVGKTTTAAKLAAHCVVKYGAKSLGLITVDNYRIGAEDHLRAYGKILGVTVHTAHDAQTLSDLTALMRDKRLVLIDTVGMSQRDDRLAAQLQMLTSPGIEHVLFLNASAQGETMDDVVRLYGGSGQRRTRKVIISKLDEAVKFGFALDCVIRHKLEVQFVTNGQRVPEDIHPANPQYLVHRALNHRAAPAYALEDTEIPLVLFTPPQTAASGRNTHHA